MTDNDLIRRGDAKQSCTNELRNTAHLLSNPPQSSAAWDARNAIDAIPAVQPTVSPDVAALVEALHNCVGMLDQLVAESGRDVEWGEEDPFRMGEWFEPEDLAQLAQARAALARVKSKEGFSDEKGVV